MSLQRIGDNNRRNRQSEINFLNTDYEKLAQEIEVMEEQKRSPKKKETKLSPHKSGNLHAHQKRNMVDFDVPEPNQKSPGHEPNYESQKEAKMSRPTAAGSKNSVISARCTENGVQDIGGPKRQTKTDTSNSIWDSDKLQRLAEEMTVNKEVTDKQKENLEQQRQSIREEANERLAEQLQNVDQRKQSTVTSMSDYQGDSYKAPSENLSIFDFMGDNQEFSRVDKSEGERLSQKLAEQKQQKDDSWRSIKRQKTTSDLLSNMFTDKTQ